MVSGISIQVSHSTAALRQATRAVKADEPSNWIASEIRLCSGVTSDLLTLAIALPHQNLTRGFAQLAALGSAELL